MCIHTILSVRGCLWQKAICGIPGAHTSEPSTHTAPHSHQGVTMGCGVQCSPFLGCGVVTAQPSSDANHNWGLLGHAKVQHMAGAFGSGTGFAVGVWGSVGNRPM